jgi:hypothetical protein
VDRLRGMRRLRRPPRDVLTRPPGPDNPGPRSPKATLGHPACRHHGNHHKKDQQIQVKIHSSAKLRNRVRTHSFGRTVARRQSRSLRGDGDGDRLGNDLLLGHGHGMGSPESRRSLQ